MEGWGGEILQAVEPLRVEDVNGKLFSKRHIKQSRKKKVYESIILSIQPNISKIFQHTQPIVNDTFSTLLYLHYVFGVL